MYKQWNSTTFNKIYFTSLPAGQDVMTSQPAHQFVL